MKNYLTTALQPQTPEKTQICCVFVPLLGHVYSLFVHEYYCPIFQFNYNRPTSAPIYKNF